MGSGDSANAGCHACLHKVAMSVCAPTPVFLSFPSKLPIPPPPLPSFPPRFASVYKDACTNSVSQLPAYLQPRFNTGSQCTGFVQVTSLALCKHNKNDMLLCKMSTYWRHGRADQLFNDYAHIPPEALQVSLSKGAALHCKPHVPHTPKHLQVVESQPELACENQP